MSENKTITNSRFRRTADLQIGTEEVVRLDSVGVVLKLRGVKSYPALVPTGTWPASSLGLQWGDVIYCIYANWDAAYLLHIKYMCVMSRQLDTRSVECGT